MFSQARVILFTGGCLPQCMLGYPREQTPPQQTPPRADTPPEQTPPELTHPASPRANTHSPQEQTPPTEHAGRYGQCAGSTHPTEVQSCYRPQTKFAKVMFLQASVCPQGGGVRGCPRGGMHGCSGGGMHGCSGGHVWLLRGVGGMHGCWGACVVAPGGACVVALGGCVVAPGGGMCGCSWGGMCGCSQGGVCGCSGRGACMVAPRGGVRGCSRGGMHGCSQGACMVAPGGRMHGSSRGACMVFSMRYGQWAGGTHPTGMHSCSFYYFFKVYYCKSTVKISRKKDGRQRRPHRFYVSFPSPPHPAAGSATERI